MTHLQKYILATLGLFLLANCTSKKEKANDTVVIDRPVIQSLDDVHPDLKKLQHSLVRLRVNHKNADSFGTGFFFRSRQMLVTTYHTFEADHPCVAATQCEISLGMAKDAKDVKEVTIAADVILKDQDKDLLFLKIKDTPELAAIIPLKGALKFYKGTLTAAGFYQDNPALTFSKGKKINEQGEQTLTSIIVSQGFSGSPVVDDKGEVVGMVASFQPIRGQKIGLARFISFDGINY